MTPTKLAQLIEFLDERIGEDEARAVKYRDLADALDLPPTQWFVVAPGVKTLRECEAKRSLIRAATRLPIESQLLILAIMALVYNYHPDFDQAWVQ